jgi:hypothetical protein
MSIPGKSFQPGQIFLNKDIAQQSEATYRVKTFQVFHSKVGSKPCL